MSTYGQKGAYETNEDGAENDEEKAKSCALAAGSLSIYFSKRKGPIAFENGIEVADTIEDGNSEKKSRKATETNLEEHSFWQILSRIWHFLCHVGDGVRRANGECSVENSSQEGNATRPAS